MELTSPQGARLPPTPTLSTCVFTWVATSPNHFSTCWGRTGALSAFSLSLVSARPASSAFFPQKVRVLRNKYKPLNIYIYRTRAEKHDEKNDESETNQEITKTFHVPRLDSSSRPTEVHTLQAAVEDGESTADDRIATRATHMPRLYTGQPKIHTCKNVLKY